MEVERIINQPTQVETQIAPTLSSSLALFLSSATRVCLFMVVGTICVGRFTGTVSEEVFKSAASVIITAFFVLKSSGDNSIGGK